VLEIFFMPMEPMHIMSSVRLIIEDIGKGNHSY
jgi:hypothetical protein